MRLIDFVVRLEIDERKLTEYALSPHSERGKHKARVFRSALGFTLENYQSLLGQIKSQALVAPADMTRASSFGEHYTVDLPITGENGAIAVGWLCVSTFIKI